MARQLRASLLPVALGAALTALGFAFTLAAKAGSAETRIESLEADRVKLDRLIEAQIKIREDIAAIRAVLDRK